VIDADGNGTVGSGGDIARIYAVRMAVVARSALMEKPKADGTCDFYTSAKPLFQKPAWSAGEIDASRMPDGTAIADWECYRYKTFEAMVPLRNLIWGK
jgi:type IV pilus assembly protein PilW